MEISPFLGFAPNSRLAARLGAESQLCMCDVIAGVYHEARGCSTPLVHGVLSRYNLPRVVIECAGGLEFPCVHSSYGLIKARKGQVSTCLAELLSSRMSSF
jgi:hypothetical protein